MWGVLPVILLLLPLAAAAAAQEEPPAEEVASPAAESPSESGEAGTSESTSGEAVSTERDAGEAAERAPEEAGVEPAGEGGEEPDGEGAEEPADEAEPAGAEPAAAEEERPPASHITFSIPIPPEKGGGTIEGSAGSVQLERENFLVASDGVELRYRDLEIQAQRMAVDLETKHVTAEGEVILDRGPRRITGATLAFDLESETGELSDASAYVDPDFFFSGERIAKVGEETYTVDQGIFTSCTEQVPDWSFRVSRARVTLEGYARARHARMRLKHAPVLYTPYLLWPAKTDRTSGLLVPNIGYSERRGGYLGLAYFQTLGRSYDTTFYADLYSEEYYGFGNEVRYQPSEKTEGLFEAYAILDPLGLAGDPTDTTPEDEWRWKVSWAHETEALPWGLRGVVTYVNYSDFDFRRDFERSFNNISQRSVYSSGYVTGNWGLHSLNLLVDDRETITGDRTILLSQLPEVEYRLRSTKLGRTPLYLELVSALHYLDVNRSELLEAAYGRADMAPQLTLPLSSWPWLSVSVSGGGRVTWWGDSLGTTDGTSECSRSSAGGGSSCFTGESLSRVFPTAGAEIVGPSFSRIFDARLGRFGKFKHIIEPRWNYAYIGEFDDQDFVPLFDEVDQLRATNLGVFSLVNRVLAKPLDESLGDAREILSLELSQAYSLDEDRPLESGQAGALTSQRGPLTARLRFNPFQEVSVESQVTYSNLFDNLTATSLSGKYAFGPHDVALTWFTRYNAESGDSTSNQMRLYGGFDLLRDRLRLEASLSYDAEQGQLQQQRYIINYNSECYGLRFELGEIQVGAPGSVNFREDRDYRFALSLKNVGTFLDLTGGLSSD